MADLLPIDAGWEEASAALARVPLWFHTFSLNGAGVYTPGMRAITATACARYPSS